MSPPPGGWILTSQVAFAVLVTIALSTWQVLRGFEKLEDKHEFERRLAAPPMNETGWQNQDFEFLPVELRGTLDPVRHFIIENRLHNGRPGFWVVGVLNTQQDRYLVNRGWVPVQSDIRLLPSVETPVETVTVVGPIWPNEIVRGPGRPGTGEWPVRLREFDIGQMARLTGAKAHEVRLQCCEPVVFQPASLVMEYKTAMHWGYAAQWLLIGALVIAGYWFFTVRKDRS